MIDRPEVGCFEFPPALPLDFLFEFDLLDLDVVGVLAEVGVIDVVVMVRELLIKFRCKPAIGFGLRLLP